MAELLTNGRIYHPGAASQDSDFIDFSFGGKNASDFNIVRTSDGSRFNENLLPTIQDKTVQVPGGDGTYYFGSFYTQRQFSVPIAFNAMTETNLREMQQWLGDKKIKELVFSERPYKTYKAKCTGTATIKHICFVEKGERIYKGEGTIQFTAYYPFARTSGDKKFIDFYRKVLTLTVKDCNIPQVENKPETEGGESTFAPKWSLNDIETVLANVAREKPDNLDYAFYLLSNYFGVTFNNDKDEEIRGAYLTEKHISEWVPAAGLLGPTLKFTEDHPFIDEFGDYEKSKDPSVIKDIDTLKAMEQFNGFDKNYENRLKAGKIDNTSDYKFPFYNPGDMETDFQLYLPFVNKTLALTSVQLHYGTGGATAGEPLKFSTITRSDDRETGVRINSSTNLIEGVIKNGDSFILTGSVYNQCITAGSFFKLPATVKNSTDDLPFLQVSGLTILDGAELIYDYLYF